MSNTERYSVDINSSDVYLVTVTALISKFWQNFLYFGTKEENTTKNN